MLVDAAERVPHVLPDDDPAGLVTGVVFAPVIARLGEAGLLRECNGWRRVIIEKPFGKDLASAVHLNAVAARNFRESQIFRIDHYLGKETVQNLMALRFGNALFEPLWRRESIANIQITLAERLGVGTFH